MAIIIFVILFAVFFVIYAKFKEVNRDLIIQNNSLKEFSKKLEDISESLKRTEDLIEIRADIKELKRRGK